MRLTERSMLRIAEDLRADDLGAGDHVADGAGDHADAIDHRRWVKEREAGNTRLERVRFHVSWTGRFFRIPSFRGQA